MTTLKLVLLSFVGLCVCQDPSKNYDSDSLAELEMKKERFKFYDKKIFQRWLHTEALTCAEVDNTLKFMKKNIKSDLVFVMAQASNLLKQPHRNPEEEVCMNYIKAQIDITIKAGVDEFSKCTMSSVSILAREKAQLEIQKKEFQKKVGQEIKSISSCLNFNNADSQDNFNNCLSRTDKEIVKQIKTVRDVFNRSKCMTVFKSTILKCASDVYEKAVRKKIDLSNSIKQCVGYPVGKPVKVSFGTDIRKYHEKYSKTYASTDKMFEETMIEYFKYSYIGKRKTDKNQLQHYHDHIKRVIKYYYFALDKTLKENRLPNDKKCYNQAFGKMKDLIDKESKSYVNCHKKIDNSIKEELNIYKKTLDDFNEKFIVAGNVALLGCMRKQPQKGFDLRGIIRCADLAKRTIEWEWESVQLKVNSLHNLRWVTDPNRFSFTKTPCGLNDDKKEKLFLDSETILYDYQRCLGGQNGLYYAVTTQMPEPDLNENTSGKKTSKSELNL